MNQYLAQIRQANDLVDALVDGLIDSPDASVAVKIAAIIYGVRSANRKKALVHRVLVAHGLIPITAHVHVKNGELLASQIPIDTLDVEHYVAAIIDGMFHLVKFNGKQGHDIGVYCHGKKQRSDARRAKIESICEVVYRAPINEGEVKAA